MPDSTVTIFGLGYIGLPTAAIIASKGIRVHGIDTNTSVVNTINLGKIHITEPNLDTMVANVVANKTLTASIEPIHSNTFLITVPTPTGEGHLPDISYVEAVTRSISAILEPSDLIILESTCPIGTTEKMYQLIISLRPQLDGKFFMAYCPERVLPGNIIYELEHNDRIVGGIDPQSGERAKAFYNQFVKGEIFVTDARTAEMCKLVENAYRDVNIAFANELSMISAEAGIDVYELIRLASRHPRVKILQPGVGVGGHCIAVDPWFIISQYPDQSALMRNAREVNEKKRQWVINHILAEVEIFRADYNREPVIACMGLSYKPDIDDIRESPALFITRFLVAAGLHILPVEPHLTKLEGLQLASIDTALAKADILVFLVRHQLFTSISHDRKELDFCGLRQP